MLVQRKVSFTAYATFCILFGKIAPDVWRRRGFSILVIKRKASLHTTRHSAQSGFLRPTVGTHR